MKGYFLLLLLLISLYSCRTAQKHIEIAQKHKEKAINKGAVLNVTKDTVLIDNKITDIITKNDTVYITRTITNTVVEDGSIRYVTRFDKRKEGRLKEKIRSDSISIEKLKIRKNAVVNKAKEKSKSKKRGISKYWVLPSIFLGFLLNVIIRVVIKKIKLWVKLMMKK